PSSGSGTSQSFTFEYADSSGYTTLDTVYAYVGNGGLANSCYVYYQVSSNTLALLNDAGTAAQGAAHPGTATTLQNSQCTVNVADSSASGAGTTLSLRLSLSFSSSYNGTRGLWLNAIDSSGARSDWHMLGSWTIPAAQTLPRIQPVSFMIENDKC